MSSFFDKLTESVLNPSALAKNQAPMLIANAKQIADTDPDKAIQLLRTVTAADPGNYDAWTLLANLLSDHERSQESEQAYRKAQALKPEAAEAYLGIGTELLSQEKPGEAEPYLMHGLLLSDPINATDLYNLALALFQQSREAEAIPFCQKSLEREQDPGTAVLLGDCLFDCQSYEDAARNYQMAVDGDEENVHAAEQLGLALELLGRQEEAVSSLNHALEKGSQNPEVYGSLSRCYDSVGDQEKSQQAAEKYYELSGTRPA